jgi:hypothetical protein
MIGENMKELNECLLVSWFYLKKKSWMELSTSQIENQSVKD